MGKWRVLGFREIVESRGECGVPGVEAGAGPGPGLREGLWWVLSCRTCSQLETLRVTSPVERPCSRPESAFLEGFDGMGDGGWAAGTPAAPSDSKPPPLPLQSPQILKKTWALFPLLGDKGSFLVPSQPRAPPPIWGGSPRRRPATLFPYQRGPPYLMARAACCGCPERKRGGCFLLGWRARGLWCSEGPGPGKSLSALSY